MRALALSWAFSGTLVAELERRIPGFSDAVRIHVTGRPNACGQHWIADIGLQGVQMAVDGTSVDGFDFFIGGAVGTAPRLARRLGVRVPAAEAPNALGRVFEAGSGRRRRGEIGACISLRFVKLSAHPGASPIA